MKLELSLTEVRDIFKLISENPGRIFDMLGTDVKDAIGEYLSLLFLSGINTRTLSMISKKLVGRSISPQEVSNANNHLIESAERWRNRDLSEEHMRVLRYD